MGWPLAFVGLTALDVSDRLLPTTKGAKMRAREYLIEQGLSRKGSRGRISREAKEALVQAVENLGMVFDDLKIENGTPVFTKIEKIIDPANPPRRGRRPKNGVSKRNRVVKADATANQPKRRVEMTMWGIDKGKKPGQNDILIAFDTCANCSRGISYCGCSAPYLPGWIGGGPGLMVKPV